MKRAFIAGASYFLILFAFGFVLGTLRTIFVVPRIGELGATLAELPFMLIAALFACRWMLRRWQVPPDLAVRCSMTLCFLLLLALFETVGGAALFGRTMADQWAALITEAGLFGLSAQIIAAMLPVIFLGRRIAKHS